MRLRLCGVDRNIRATSVGSALPPRAGGHLPGMPGMSHLPLHMQRMGGAPMVGPGGWRSAGVAAVASAQSIFGQRPVVDQRTYTSFDARGVPMVGGNIGRGQALPPLATSCPVYIQHDSPVSAAPPPLLPPDRPPPPQG